MALREKASAAPLVLIANDQEWSARSLESIPGRTDTRSFAPTPASRRSSGPAPRNPILSSSTRRCRTFTGSKSAARYAAILGSAARHRSSSRLRGPRAEPSVWKPTAAARGIPRATARRRGASAQARHFPRVQASSRHPARRKSARLRHRALQHAGLGSPGSRDRRRCHPPPRGARLRGVRAGDGARRR